MATVILTWNPGPSDDEIWDPQSWHEEMVAPTAAGDVIRSDWSVARHRHGIGPGDRAFLFRQGEHGRGLVAIGVIDSTPEEGPHWADAGATTNYVDVTWTHCLRLGDRVLVETLEQVTPEFNWRAVLSSGRRLPESCELSVEGLWYSHVGWPERGSCPRCGSDDVTHYLMGEPTRDAHTKAPPWLVLGGCVMGSETTDRSCDACGHHWHVLPSDNGLRAFTEEDA